MLGVKVMVFNATFNNISAISWWSVLLVEETGVPGENHQPAASDIPGASCVIKIKTEYFSSYFWITT
jgi:hypothetical protein